jgi:hypothetical protein
MRKILIIAALLGAIGAPAGAQAASYDGTWRVTIITDKGDCDKAYAYVLAVKSGRVSYAGEGDFKVAGSVSDGGAVKVGVSRGSQRADGTGKLSGAAGTGAWRGVSSSGACSGHWEAERR